MKKGEVMGHEIRVNQFDAWVGEEQAKINIEEAIRYGSGISLLDIGCGKGELTKRYGEVFDRVVGLEPVKEYVKEADRSTGVEYVQGDGETFDLDEEFDVIILSMVIEHTNNPITILRNCKKHLAEDGIIIIQTPNANSVTRRLGVEMGMLDSIHHMTEREITECGHTRIYTMSSLTEDVMSAGLYVVDSYGILYKPLPNAMLEKLCIEQGEEWRKKFIDALITIDVDDQDCANLCVICQ